MKLPDDTDRVRIASGAVVFNEHDAGEQRPGGEQALVTSVIDFEGEF